MSEEVFIAADGSPRRRLPTALQERFLRSSFRDRHGPKVKLAWGDGYFDPRKQVRDDLAALRALRRWNAGL